MSHYPLNAELYEVNGAIYRRPPYRGLNNNTLPAGGGDTVDLYDDDDHEEEYAHDDGPVCAAEGSVVDPGAPPGLECVKGLIEALPRAPVDPRVRQVDHPIPKWTASVDVPVNLHALLIGRGFATKKEMEDATRCRVNIPARGSNSTVIYFCNCLFSQALVHSATKKKWTKTHFVALKCNTPEMQRGFNRFIAMVNRIPEAHVSMRNDELFPESAKLHMTIAMVCIQTEEDKAKARAALDEIKERYNDEQPINMEITGLDYMNDDPTQVHVLYGKAVIKPGVQEWFDDVRHAFWKQGLLHPNEKEHDSVKLHMTVMNTRYAATAPDDDYHASKDYANRVPFNAASLVDYQYDFDFGWQELDTVAICEFGTINWDDGFYETLMQEKLGPVRIDRYKPRIPIEPFKWFPRKRATLAKMPKELRQQHAEREERLLKEGRHPWRS
ncbi:ascc-1 [Pristionchus pacificus]|uniref:K Homology domain containing protein n=1 Tax=Pristionchus pacificus TaxID=54126 RepID=A0A2A6CFW4_PRIPA|nr:ascc-1 [Pristionchus pacificus]|eukprot:PDM77029.1 K Homology domain containing protein [Pristionchus pacificus]